MQTVIARRTSKHHNPYVERIREHQDHILLFEDFDADRENVQKLFAAWPKVYCEIGSGSGGHLIERAKIEPEALFLGMEIRYKRTCRTIEKAKYYGLNNIYLLRIDAVHLPRLLNPESLDGVYVNFPDPWEKRRRRKNRILNDGFLNTICQLLRSMGFLSVKTDHREYFSSFLQTASSHNGLELVDSSVDLANSSYEALNVQTEFERLFRYQGLPICFAKFIKKQ